MQNSTPEISSAMRLMQDYALNAEWDDALLCASHILSLEPNNSIANIVIADALMAREEYADALPYYKAAWADAPQNGHICYQMAKNYECLGDINSATRFFNLSMHLLDKSGHDADRAIGASAKESLEKLTTRPAERTTSVLGSIVGAIRKYAASYR